MIHSASHHSPGRQWLSLDWFWSFGRDVRTDWRTLCVKIVITTGRECGRPRESTNLQVVLVQKNMIDYDNVLRPNLSIDYCFNEEEPQKLVL